MGDKAGNSNPVSDISFAQCGPQDVMLVSERGGMRNQGLGKTEPFATPYELRVLRYERGQDGIWRPKGRYDVGFHDRSIKDGEPVEFSSSRRWRCLRLRLRRRVRQHVRAVEVGVDDG